MPTDREILKRLQAGLVSGSKEFASDPQTEVNKTHRRRVVLNKFAADSAAGNATANGIDNSVAIYHHASLYNKAKLVAARIISPVTVTASGSNYATINVTKSNGAGGSATVILSATTKDTANSGLGNLAAGSYVSLTSSIINTSDASTCDAGSLLQVNVAKTGSGVALPAGVTIELEFEEV